MYKLNEKKYLEIRENLSKVNKRDLHITKRVLSLMNELGYKLKDLEDYLHDNVVSVEKTTEVYREVINDQPPEMRCPDCGLTTSVYQ